jgi:AraC-like DNA-binding protein
MTSDRLAPSRRALSRTRHPEGPIRTFSLDLDGGTLAPPQPAGWAHLVTLRSGVATVRSGRARVLLTRDVAVWVPQDNQYALDFGTRCELRILYVAEPIQQSRPFGTFRMTPLMHGLIDRATTSGYLDPELPRDARVLAVIDDELTALVPGAPAHTLLLPRDAFLRSSIESALADPGDAPAIALLAAAAAMSRRTFERRFARETGLGPRAWLRRAQLSAATVLLCSGASVTEAALAVGYSSVSAFIAAYRSVFGTTPGRGLREPL